MNEKITALNENIMIRSLRESDLDAAAELWLTCFPEDDRAFVDYYFARRTDPDRMLGVFVKTAANAEPVLASMLCFDPRRMFAKRPGTGEELVLPVCFVAGVCTFPAYRRRGYVRRLLTALADERRAAGDAALLLKPFNIGFYEKLGFSRFAFRRMLTVERPVVPDAEKDRISTVPLTAELLNEVYSAANNGRNGALIRRNSDCAALAEEYRLSGAHSAAVRTETGAAYALYWERNGENGNGTPALLDEFTCTDASSGAALASVLFDRIGLFRFPVPVGENAEMPINCRRKCAQEGETECFSLLLPLDTEYDFLLSLDPPPFDTTAY